MKITIPIRRRRDGALVVVLAMLLAVVMIIGIGGCVIGKLIEKGEGIRAKREHDLTNEVENFIQENATPGARVFVEYSRQDVYVVDGDPMIQIQVSTDLTKWTDLGPASSLGAAVWSAASSTSAPPFQFFRVKP